MPKYRHKKGGGTEGADPQAFNLNGIISNILNITLNITLMITIVAMICIVVTSLINILILIGISASDTVKYDTDMIYKDTLKYRILKYWDHINNKELPEPFFIISNGTVALLSLIYMCYGFLLIVCILCALIYLIFAVLIRFMYPDFKIDDTSKIEFSTDKIFNFGVALGIILPIALGIFHYFYMNNYIKPELNTVKQAIASIDSHITEGITKGNDGKFSTDLFNLLRKKNKGTEDYEKYKPFILADIQNNNIAKAKQKIIIILLYTHLHDNIPNTNKRAQELINYYFFKEPKKKDEEVDVRMDDFISDLSFISLLVEDNGIKQIDNYMESELYAGLSADAVTEIKTFFNELNKKLQEFPTFDNKIYIFAGYFLVFFILAAIFALMFMKILSRTDGISKSVQDISNNLSNLAFSRM